MSAKPDGSAQNVRVSIARESTEAKGTKNRQMDWDEATESVNRLNRQTIKDISNLILRRDEVPQAVNKRA